MSQIARTVNRAVKTQIMVRCSVSGSGSKTQTGDRSVRSNLSSKQLGRLEIQSRRGADFV